MMKQNQKNNTKKYSEMLQLSTFEDRYNYLKLHGDVGRETFGNDRYMNQQFYRSAEWKRVRDQVIVRDGGCDLGLPDHKISGKIYIHHINPLTLDDITNNPEKMLDPENLVCVSHVTHNAIHYGDDTILRTKQLTERTPNDMCPWRK